MIGFREKIAITGGSGYVGKILAEYLSKKYDIKLIDVNSPSSFLGEGVEFYNLDVRDLSLLKKNLDDCTFVIHAAIIQIPKIIEQKRLGYEVNIVGTQNVCAAVNELPNLKGMILAGSWHTIGEREFNGVIDEEFGFRPDKVEERARLYSLSKIAQETIVRFYSEMSDKQFGIIRMGTVLGNDMPKETAANIFIERGLNNQSITPYRHSMHRPMLFVDESDICLAYERLLEILLNKKPVEIGDILSNIINVYYPVPTTVFELAEIVQKTIIELSLGGLSPQIEIVDKGSPLLFSTNEKNNIKVSVDKAKKILKMENFTSPRDSIRKIVKKRLISKES